MATKFIYQAIGSVKGFLVKSSEGYSLLLGEPKTPERYAAKVLDKVQAHISEEPGAIRQYRVYPFQSKDRDSGRQELSFTVVGVDDEKKQFERFPDEFTLIGRLETIVRDGLFVLRITRNQKMKGKPIKSSITLAVYGDHGAATVGSIVRVEAIRKGHQLRSRSIAVIRKSIPAPTKRREVAA